MHALLLLVQVVTQVSLILLLFGTVIGDFALLADVGQRALRRLSPSAPELLVGYDGRGIMVLLTLCVVLPLCLLRKCAPALLLTADIAFQQSLPSHPLLTF